MTRQGCTDVVSKPSPAWWVPLASSQEAVGRPLGRCTPGHCSPSVGGCLSHCLAIFKEELSFLALRLKLGGCLAWGQPPTPWDRLGWDVRSLPSWE